ncbi:hypothetical protein Airi01_004610 [Actinoallomurus iriomotensis]|uniref:Knr4/Smi1-like domain-containing protein n=1 Tax=Actinoallomurus iriomotensis TaxID=478107 RepID=A0A9W6RAT1_9ACTN|nr:hypothetical protein Airi01_004610 [Actinoallomurus iriomotensis]
MYLVADGEDPRGPDRSLFANACWLSLESLIREHLEQTVPGCADPDADWDEVFLHADPPHTVRRCAAHPGWVTFAMANDGDALAVDLAPARDGRPGQVIKYGPDPPDHPIYVADSVTSLLGGYLDRLEQGAYTPDTRRPGGLDLWADVYEDEVPSTVTGAIPNPVPPGLQEVHVNDPADLVDLTPLTAAPTCCACA